jgi:ketosteroid isomerase-like protein
MTPTEIVGRWLELFNAGDADALAALYHDDAVNTESSRARSRAGRRSATCFAGTSRLPR